MPIDFRKPQFFKEFRIGSTLIWSTINGILTTVSGVSPLSLTNALAKNIASLVQYGKLSVSGSTITCNNGELKVVNNEIVADGAPEEIVVQGENLFDPAKATTSNGAYGFTITQDGDIYTVSGVSTYTGNPAFAITTNYANSDLSGKGYVCQVFDQSGTHNVANAWGFRTKSEKAFALALSSVTAGETVNVSFKISVSATSQTTWTPYHHETAHAENLFAVDGIADEQDIITGKVIRRTEAVVSDGTTPSGRYIGEVGEGNIIIKARETGYTGEVASFTTEEETPLAGLRVNLEPIQDLNGYSYPWPAGGGKNLLNPDTVTKTSTINYANGIWTMNPFNTSAQIITMPFASHIGDSVTVSFTAWASDTTAARFDGQPDSVCTIGTDFSDKTVNLTTNKNRFSYSGTILDGTTGFRIFRTSSIVGAQTVSVYIENIQIELGSTATDYAPYSNICPISGWTGANVTRCGKNFVEIDSAWIGSSGTHNGITWRFNEDGSMTLDGTKTTSTASILIWNFANAARISGTQSDNKKHIPNGDYFIYTGHGKATVQVYGSNDENAGASNSYSIASGNLNPFRFTINDTYKYNWIRLNIAGNAVFDNYTFYPMVRLASDTGTEQAPYTGATYSITFPSEAGTVYGGTLDVTTGKLTVDRAMVDLGTLAWSETTTSGSNKRVVSAGIENTAKRPSSSSVVANIICSNYKTVSANNVYNEIFGISFTSSGYISAYDPNYQTGAAFKTAMSGVQLVYELATPQTYQLTPTQIELFTGENNIWSNAKSVNVYVSDGKVIEQVTPQKLKTAEETNTVTVTAEVDDINLEITYYTTE